MKVGLSFASPTAFVLHRFIVSAVILSPILFFLRRRIPRDSHILGKLILLSIVYSSQMVVSGIGLVEESSGVGAVLTFTQPLFVFCLAIPFLKERITAIKLLGATTGFAGVAILSLGKIGSFTPKSTLIMILGAFLWAVTIVYYKTHLSHVDPLLTNFSQLSVGALFLAVLRLNTNSLVLPNDVAYLWIILYCSVGDLVIGTTIWLFLLKEEEAIVLSSSSFIIPVIALLFGWGLLRESIYTESIIGSALILGGVCLVNLQIDAHAIKEKSQNCF